MIEKQQYYGECIGHRIAVTTIIIAVTAIILLSHKYISLREILWLLITRKKFLQEGEL